MKHARTKSKISLIQLTAWYKALLRQDTRYRFQKDETLRSTSIIADILVI